MKTLIDHINEALKIGKDISSFSTYSCQPKTKEELIKIIKDRITKDGPKCDLNDIDVSLITDMSWMFNWSKFNSDISKWDVSKAKNLQSMFERSKFNNDISRWKISSVMNMSYMFCSSQFNQDISDWKIKEDCDTNHIFHNCSIKEEFKPKSLQK